MKRIRKVSKTAKRRLIVLIPVTVVAVGYFLISLTYHTYKIIHLKNEEKSLQKELYSLQEEESSLKINIEKLQNPDYLARYARENYHYSKDGELVIQRKDELKETPKEEVIDDNKSIIILCIFGLFIIMLYIFKRKPKKR